MARLTPMEARAILHRCGVGLCVNFFTLDSAAVAALLDEAKARGYRKAKYAPGSTGRMFHGYVTRTANRED